MRWVKVATMAWWRIDGAGLMFQAVPSMSSQRSSSGQAL
jgi:hypothetical protein